MKKLLAICTLFFFVGCATFDTEGQRAQDVLGLSDGDTVDEDTFGSIDDNFTELYGIIDGTTALTTPVLGTPTSVTLTNGTSLPISTGVSGLGTNVATALAEDVGASGSVVVLGGAGGTPSSINLSNSTSLPTTESWATTGTIQGRAKIFPITASTDLTLATHHGSILLVTEDAVVIGLWSCVTDNIGSLQQVKVRDAAEQVSLYSQDASNQFRLTNGTELTAGNEVDLTIGGNEIFTFMCAENEKWHVWTEDDTVTDGGAHSY